MPVKFVTAVHGSIRFIPHAFQIFQKRRVELWTDGIFVWYGKKSAKLYIYIYPPLFRFNHLEICIVKDVTFIEQQHLFSNKLVSLSLIFCRIFEGYFPLYYMKFIVQC